jgi:hypothetical protein
MGNFSLLEHCTPPKHKHHHHRSCHCHQCKPPQLECCEPKPCHTKKHHCD